MVSRMLPVEAEASTSMRSNIHSQARRFAGRNVFSARTTYRKVILRDSRTGGLSRQVVLLVDFIQRATFKELASCNHRTSSITNLHSSQCLQIASRGLTSGTEGNTSRQV